MAMEFRKGLRRRHLWKPRLLLSLSATEKDSRKSWWKDTMLDRVKSGFLCTWHRQQLTWSRFRNASTTGQSPLRSRLEPLGLCSLKPQELEKVMQSNLEWATVLWLINQSVPCRSKKVCILLVFLEDFGGHVDSGPASPLSAREVHDIVCTSDVRRGSAFLCQLAGAYCGAVGILTNLQQVKCSFFLHWPTPVRCGDELLYNGSFLECCPCVPQHTVARNGCASGLRVIIIPVTRFVILEVVSGRRA